MKLSNHQHATYNACAEMFERRTHERINVHLPIVLKLSVGSSTINESALSRDVSSSGAFCYLKHLPNIGDRVEVLIAPHFRHLARTSFPSLIPARVVRTSRFDGFGMHGVALSFGDEI